MHLTARRSFLLTLTAILAFCSSAFLSFAAQPPDPIDGPPPPEQSRTGPVPPAAVVQRDAARPAPDATAADVVLDSVPIYYWRHGCGPTAIGMVVGYYDGHGYPDLIDGSATTQTEAVEQAIASGGEAAQPFSPGHERHYEDYALPEDEPPNKLTDNVIAAGRTPHPDDSVADFMFTSRSTSNNYYGWSWSNHVIPAWQGYVSSRNPGYEGTAQPYYFIGSSTPRLTWSVLTTEIDAGRPMVFLVDSDGNGGTDHFVTAIGYRGAPAGQYASRDTWYAAVRWADFAVMQSGKAWGIWGGWSFGLSQCNPPGPITTVEGVVIDSETVRVRWGEADEAEEYEVWRAADATIFDIGSRSCSNPDPYTCRSTDDLWMDYEDLGDAAVHHAYRVRAAAECGALSAPSAVVAEFEFGQVR